jgi:uncharacterized membrane protein
VTLDVMTPSHAHSMPDRGVRAPGSRDIGIDALRGFAVVTMVGANMVPYLLEEPYPFWLRVFASLAAPTFVLLAGFMVGHRSADQPRSMRRCLKRAAELLLVAALIDHLIWGTAPFSTFDILYLIALVLPLAQVAQRLPRAAVLVFAGAVFVATRPLQQFLGYGRDISEPLLDRLQALLVDGWFPVFPWLGIGLVGSVLGAVNRQRPEFVARRLHWVGLACFAAGIARWWHKRPFLPTRGGYAELFYPPSLAFVLAALGVALCLLGLMLHYRRSPVCRLLAVYGRASLLIYVVHLATITLVVDRFVQGRGWPVFLLSYAAHVVVLWCLARVVARYSHLWPRTFLLRRFAAG